MDLVGYATYAVPFLGEIGDIIWAPISSIIFMSTFGGWKGALGGIGNFIEEILPALTLSQALRSCGSFRICKRKKQEPLPGFPANLFSTTF
jgi:hypothetical protein